MVIIPPHRDVAQPQVEDIPPHRDIVQPRVVIIPPHRDFAQPQVMILQTHREITQPQVVVTHPHREETQPQVVVFLSHRDVIQPQVDVVSQVFITDFITTSETLLVRHMQTSELLSTETETTPREEHTQMTIILGANLLQHP